MIGKWRAASCLLTVLALAPRAAQARVQTEAGYTKLQTFNGALRFIRIDHGFAITEKDLDSGYLLFEYRAAASDEPTTGSVEVIEKEDGVSVIVQLPQMPEHHERYLADGLLAKLRSDYGDPPRRPAPPNDSKKSRSKEEPPKEDSGPDKGDGAEDDKARDGQKTKKPASSEEGRVPGYRIK